MKLGWSMGYWGAGPRPGIEQVVAEADRLGLDSIWTAESYGSDALTPLAWYGARTTRPRLGTGIVQMSARTPTAVGMAAMTLDHLSGGRLILGLGTSGPQVVEGWYGQEYGKPLARTRQYVDIVRKVVARERLTYQGADYRMPIEGGTGLGKPLRSTIRPLRDDIPIFLGAQGPKNVALAAEIADGWLTLFFGPKLNDHYRKILAEGFARPGARRDKDGFEVAVSVDVVVDDDIEAAADKVRPGLALYIGGMGAAEVNFHRNQFVRMGYEQECEKITELYLAGRKDEAIAAVSTKMVEEVALIGPKAKIADDLAGWRNTIATSLILQRGDIPTLRTMAELME
ncbi:LLM class F420-dependent oxidoreductase [Fodinicola feengrottensis]|uniref:LLM class F420-dependent oxidoreductase n=1 Tax=Fodinicola feengrottensis TaxID=435914 RepID=A0ABN2I110_9ACTN|nr:LLM class F420-dependent oxidoreductase [Fodinicola feengrottensis]